MGLEACVGGIGLVAPGMADWAAAQPLLRGEQLWQPTALAAPKPDLLPANERRRTTTLIRLALAAAEQACSQAGVAPEGLASVFASAEGDTEIVERLCTALNMAGKPVSPTQFHNSVHNAPAGYWAIAAGARLPSTSITAGVASFAAGLLDALCYLQAEQAPVLLIAYDVALPDSLSAHGDVQQPFACALLLSPSGEGPRLLLDGITTGEPSAVRADLDALRRANPAAQALPLLHGLANGKAERLALRYVDQQLLNVVLR